MFRELILPLAVLAFCAPAAAKPIAFGDGYTFMYEYGAGTMQEAQLFYAPKYWYSVGAGHLRLEPEGSDTALDISYARFNYLVQRWNLPAAQGNVFAYGGAGSANSDALTSNQAAWNAGAQADYETRRIYGSIKTDYQRGSDFAFRVDTLQLGLAPYLHDYNGIATWLVVQARQSTGGLSEGVETAAMIRLFGARSWGSVWFEGGVTDGGDLQTMIMLNF